MLLAFALLLAVAPSSTPNPDPRAAAVIDTAIARMGGASVLGGVERVRFEMMTQWQRPTFDQRPYADAPSYEVHSELRDYTIPAWRNTRRQPNGPPWSERVEVVRDSVATRTLRAVAAPLNVAYVDERRELFAFAPERLLLAARAASDLRTLPDTIIGGLAHARVAATIARFPATIFLRRGDGFLAMARYRAAQPNDFGLSPWGEMDVELWYSRWQKLPPGIAYPLQWDVRRVGLPYKRMTVLGATFNVAAAPDSFAVSDSLRAAFFRTANVAMYDLPLDSAKIIDRRFATFGAFGTPTGAVKLGGRWLLVEAGQAPLTVERSVRWLERADAGATVAGALVTIPAQANGGVAWLAAQRVPMHVAPGARPFVATMLRNWKQPASSAMPIAGARWLRVDGDSIRIEPIDLPDTFGAVVAYVPSLRWVYCALAVTPLYLDLVMARARERGWIVERVGSLRGIATPVPATPARAGGTE